MHDHEMRGLLGPMYDDTTDDQRRIIDQACDLLDKRWPGPGWTDERTEALNAMLEVVLGDTAATVIAEHYSEARQLEKEARLRLTGAIIAESLAGVPESTLAARLGVTRMTVRKALGK